MLVRELLNGLILLSLDHGNGGLSLLLHVLPQEQHLMLELGADLVADAFVLPSHLCRPFVPVAGQRVQVVSVAHFLLFLLDLQRADICFELSLFNPVLIFILLEFNLGLLLEFSELIQVLEYQVLHSLLVDFNLNFILFNQILKFTLFVTQTSLAVFQVFLRYNPKVVHTLPFILVQSS